MADVRCPEPKPVLIVLSGVAGALAGGIWDVLRFLGYGWKIDLRDATFDTAREGAFGIAAAVCIALSSSFWIRVPGSLVSGWAAYLFYSVGVNFLTQRQWAPTGSNAIHALILGLPPVLAITLAHVALLKSRRFLAMVLFPLLGALSMMPNLYRFHVEYTNMVFSDELLVHVWGLAEGLMFGLSQLAAMLAALAVDRKMRPLLDAPPAAPSPGPGP